LAQALAQGLVPTLGSSVSANNCHCVCCQMPFSMFLALFPLVLSLQSGTGEDVASELVPFQSLGRPSVRDSASRARPLMAGPLDEETIVEQRVPSRRDLLAGLLLYLSAAPAYAGLGATKPQESVNAQKGRAVSTPPKKTGKTAKSLKSAQKGRAVSTLPKKTGKTAKSVKSAAWKPPKKAAAKTKKQRGSLATPAALGALGVGAYIVATGEPEAEGKEEEEPRRTDEGEAEDESEAEDEESPRRGFLSRFRRKNSEAEAK